MSEASISNRNPTYDEEVMKVIVIKVLPTLELSILLYSCTKIGAHVQFRIFRLESVTDLHLFNVPEVDAVSGMKQRLGLLQIRLDLLGLVKQHRILGLETFVLRRVEYDILWKRLQLSSSKRHRKIVKVSE